MDTFTALRIFNFFWLCFLISFFVYTNYLTNRRIHGRYIKDKYAVKFLQDHLQGYEYNGGESFPKPSYFQGVNPVPFIGKTHACLFSKWKINGYGRIRRFSRAHYMIENWVKRERNTLMWSI